MALADDLAALKAMRNRGVLEEQAGDKRVKYASTAELDRAISAVQAEIDAATSPQPTRIVRSYGNMGT